VNGAGAPGCRAERAFYLAEIIFSPALLYSLHVF